MYNLELHCDQMVRHDFLNSATKTCMYVCCLVVLGTMLWNKLTLLSNH